LIDGTTLKQAGVTVSVRGLAVITVVLVSAHSRFASPLEDILAVLDLSGSASGFGPLLS
jgi:hypothetical protein